MLAAFKIPGFDRNGRYLARISARSALFSDFQVLLLTSVDRSVSGFRNAVITENRLARASHASRMKLYTELKGRYILDDSHPLFAAFLAEWIAAEAGSAKTLVAFVLFALNDRTVSGISCDWLFPHLQRAPSDLRLGDLTAHLQRCAASTHPEILRWTEKTLTRVAQHYLASVRDFGLAAGGSRKVSVRAALYAAPVRLILRALDLARVPPRDVLRHEAFKLLGIAPDEVIDALSELNRQGALRFRMQADIVELSL